MGTRRAAVSNNKDSRLNAPNVGDKEYSGLPVPGADRASLTGLAGVLSKNQIAIVRGAVAEGRDRSRKRRSKRVR